MLQYIVLFISILSKTNMYTSTKNSFFANKMLAMIWASNKL